MHGGDIIAKTLQAHGVRFVFTLCGGHISPILTGAKALGIRVVDVRHEATAVFAADAVSRLSGVPGVAAVTAGPGATNTLTAVKNAQLAQSPLVLLVGATATALKGRGALQDIDQMALFKPHVKWAKAVRRVRDLVPALQRAFQASQSGVPGPVMVECPVDLLYPESLVRDWYGLKSQSGESLGERALRMYLDRHVENLFDGAGQEPRATPLPISMPPPDPRRIARVAARLQQAQRPLMLIGSQAMLHAEAAHKTAEAVAQLGVPVYLSGMARGLLGAQHDLQMRHQRRQALKDADVVILAGVPCDFRLDYGRHIRRSSFLISANRSLSDLRKNRRPNLSVLGDAGLFLQQLAEALPGEKPWSEWIATLRGHDQEREAQIAAQAKEKTANLNPVHFCQQLAKVTGPKSMLVADGGDFVAIASYLVSPPGPLTWLDPGVFGTLGVGAGFALGAKLCRPESEVWILYGDGSAGYSLQEFDTFVRHEIPVLAVVGNDAGWTQIAREQVEVLKDDVGTVLRHSDYHIAAEGFGGRGFLLTDKRKISKTFREAKQALADGHPVLINALLGKTDFRKGSISM